ncbi:S8 family serine peptidase [Abyssalbus ytuae]|uniref:S8 family serine peptidase n=1 Tax=Abyssalbus ytuae TaxID=2926907 RepID=A0A9E6ZI59_9FLAO|nr:S8 family serine peptidase [Abyssalbus ytuae]UOB15944.1 S8 family serine peptidase [Abyssalbus ytuae]
MKKSYIKSFLLVCSLGLFQSLFAQTGPQKKIITERYNKQQILQLKNKFQQKEGNEKQRALQLAKINNWPVTISKNNTYLELQKVSEEGRPVYYTTFNADASFSTRTNHLNSGGSLGLSLNGQNMIAHIWDGGLALATHQEYDGAGGTNRFSVGDGTTTVHYHSAHVTGTIIASGVQANAKGMAPYAQAIGYDWNSDISEATSAANNGMLISNHSYGYATRDPDTGEAWLPDYYFGGYIDDSRDWDELMYNAPYYLMVVAAGNDGDDNTANGAPLGGNSSYDKLTGHSTSKNNLVVANAQDANVDSSGNLISVTINSSSSEGPTDDFRIKPDITGNGTDVISTLHRNDADYYSLTGTSMASPNVAGSLLLLQEHANNVNGSFLRAASLKGIALHTADDAGPAGPDAVYGWGLLNSKNAAMSITNNGSTSLIQELTLTNGQTYQITVDSDNVNDLIASVSWTDLPGTTTTVTNSSTPVLVNDLDIRVTKGSTTYTPWKLTGLTTNGKGDNDVDPYERVDVEAASGSYTITVTHKGTLSTGSQAFTLIVTGINSSGSTPTCSDGIQNGDETGVDCGGSCEPCQTSSNCTGEISTFPYSETFESGIGAWTQDSNDNLDWTRDSAGTPSSSTGPSSGADGSFYMFIESSTSGTGYPNKTAFLNSPCFDLTSAAQATFEFSYHMYGSSMGTLTLEASTDNGSTWASLWSTTGNQGDSWFTASVNLSAYLGDTVKLRFNGVTGSSYTSDMAIDAISLTTDSSGGGSTECTNISLSITFDNYPEETSWEILDSNGAVAYSGGTYGDQADGSTLNLTGCIDDGCYTLVFYDSYGDGMCCNYGNGSYTLTNTDTGTVLVTGGSFSSSQSDNFCLGDTTQSNLMYTASDINEEILDVVVYPVPVKGNILNLKTSASVVKYNIVNTLGQIVLEGETNNKSINVSTLNKGLHIINMQINSKTVSKRFIKE